MKDNTDTMQIVRYKKGSAHAHNKYCGPAAMSILTQQHTGDCAAWVRKWRRANPDKATRDCDAGVTGVNPTELIPVLTERGYTLIDETPERFEQANLRKWLEATACMRGNAKYLINIRWHWVVVQGDYMNCAQCYMPINWRTVTDKRDRRRKEGHYVKYARLNLLARMNTKRKTTVYRLV